MRKLIAIALMLLGVSVVFASIWPAPAPAPVAGILGGLAAFVGFVMWLEWRKGSFFDW